MQLALVAEPGLRQVDDGPEAIEAVAIHDIGMDARLRVASVDLLGVRVGAVKITTGRAAVGLDVSEVRSNRADVGACVMRSR